MFDALGALVHALQLETVKGILYFVHPWSTYVGLTNIEDTVTYNFCMEDETTGPSYCKKFVVFL